MLQYILDYVFRRRSVADITTKLNKIVAKLDDHRTRSIVRADAKSYKAIVLKQQAEEHLAEVARSERVAGKLKELLA